MLRVYRGWTITSLNSKTLVAEKNGRTITGEWEEIVPKIDTYEYEIAKEERGKERGKCQHQSKQN